MPETEITRILPLAFIAPHIVEAVLDGQQPIELKVCREVPGSAGFSAEPVWKPICGGKNGGGRSLERTRLWPISLINSEDTGKIFESAEHLTDQPIKKPRFPGF